MDGVNLDSLRGLRKEVVLKESDRKREREMGCVKGTMSWTERLFTKKNKLKEETKNADCKPSD